MFKPAVRGNPKTIIGMAIASGLCDKDEKTAIYNVEKCIRETFELRYPGCYRPIYSLLIKHAVVLSRFSAAGDYNGLEKKFPPDETFNLFLKLVEALSPNYWGNTLSVCLNKIESNWSILYSHKDLADAANFFAAVFHAQIDNRPLQDFTNFLDFMELVKQEFEFD